MDNNSPFSTVVFAGGGNRCLWQVGFWSVAAPELQIQPETVAGVSAGASMACLILSGRTDETFNYFIERTSANKKNTYFSNIFRGKPVFPHEGMYRDGLSFGITNETLKTIHEGPDIRILMSHPPAWSGPRLATLLGLGAYSIEKIMKNPVHPELASRLGFTPEIVRARDCKTPEELIDTLLQSSCTPPFTPLCYRNDKPVLDGGLIDNVPVKAIDEGNDSVLVLLTRQYPMENIPATGNRVYVQPSVPIRISKWDYTNPAGMQDAYDLGKKDGEMFVQQVRKAGIIPSLL